MTTEQSKKGARRDTEPRPKKPYRTPVLKVFSVEQPRPPGAWENRRN